ncbi:MAG: hypothetical protein ABIU95_11435, partial [Burkholderiales bacterium]
MTVISAPPAAPAATPGSSPGARQRLGRLGWAAVAIAAAVALPILAVVAQLFGTASTTSAHLAATV